ncbi:MAG: DUF1343 domain-containing protein [Bacteroidales bacterium]|jgi:uncharacterized protein YbbC (DUF1343 family)|nr:DUF1343 domain-containing protein [Bacteroidales bacterium]
MNYIKYLFLVFILFNLSCVGQVSDKKAVRIKTGAQQTEKYVDILKNKNIAVVANHTTNINGSHLVDSLLSLGVDIIKIFSPEHGFRGKADAGEHVNNYIDKKTGLPVISLYGNSKKPNLNDLTDIDIVVFDLQDVGVRYYTYISTMHYVMEACAEMNVELLILDRPNPNGFYVDGPILDTSYQSFVGMHPVPIVHGMTVAEYAQMVNGEGWLKNSLACNLSFIPCGNYTHDSLFVLALNPSPNLQNMLSVYLYPSLGFFEGTSMSAGRGTEFPFQVFGGPDLQNAKFTFTPKSIDGASKYPKYKNEKCFGVDLRKIEIEDLIFQKKINLEWLLFAYNNIENQEHFFNSFFYNISGTDQLKKLILQGKSAEEIRKSWQPGLKKFKKTRKKYLIYKDFE